MAAVLIVDDAGFVRKILQNLLTEVLGAPVLEASNGDQAIAICRSEPVSLVFMDLVLPGKNGVETAAELLASFPHMKIIAVSTIDQQWLKEKALAAGCVAFLEKPFTHATVRKMLSQYYAIPKRGVHHG